MKADTCIIIFADDHIFCSVLLLTISPDATTLPQMHSGEFKVMSKMKKIRKTLVYPILFLVCLDFRVMSSLPKVTWKTWFQGNSIIGTLDG